jgi:hypothetical protein
LAIIMIGSQIILLSVWRVYYTGCLGSSYLHVSVTWNSIIG